MKMDDLGALPLCLETPIWYTNPQHQNLRTKADLKLSFEFAGHFPSVAKQKNLLVDLPWGWE